VISIVMPFWQRQGALDRTIISYIEHYRELELDLVVVDDGSPNRAELQPERLPRKWSARVLRLPAKTGPLNPCVPLNRGVEFARGDVIVITNPEVVHRTPVLEAMREQLEELGSSGYVLAAAWCPERGEWHCHSSCRSARDQGVPQPAGSGLHFCAMLRRELFDRAGGFDEDYRAGRAFEDNDWVMRLYVAGARFCLRDDLVVHHHKDGATTKWTPGQHARNRERYFEKWGAYAC